jgi:hypothetical protein
MSDKYYTEYDSSERKWSIWLTTPSDPKAFDEFITELKDPDMADVIVDVLNHLKGYS